MHFLACKIKKKILYERLPEYIFLSPCFETLLRLSEKIVRFQILAPARPTAQCSGEAGHAHSNAENVERLPDALSRACLLFDCWNGFLTHQRSVEIAELQRYAWAQCGAHSRCLDVIPVLCSCKAARVAIETRLTISVSVSSRAFTQAGLPGTHRQTHCPCVRRNHLGNAPRLTERTRLCEIQM